MNDETVSLGDLEEYVLALEGGALSDPESDLPAAPDLRDAAFGADDAERARALLQRVNDLVDRVEGQRVRVAGEIAARPKRPRSGHRRSPGSFDATI